MADPQTTWPICPTCGQELRAQGRLSPRALAELASVRKAAATRGGFIWEGARPAYEAGHYHDAVLSELIAAGAIEPHENPAKGWIVK